MGLEPTRTSYQSPRQSEVAERFVWAVRRDLLDHAIVLDDEHLQRPLGEYRPTTTMNGRISGSRRTRRWPVPWSGALQGRRQSMPDGGSGAYTTGTRGPRPHRRVRDPHRSRIWVHGPVRPGRRTGQ